jgi:hypothetical protein
VLEILNPPLLDAPRTVLKRLEKALNLHDLTNSTAIIFFEDGAGGPDDYACGQPHDAGAIAAAKQYAIARAQQNGWEEAWVWIGTNPCDACRALRLRPQG